MAHWHWSKGDCHPTCLKLLREFQHQRGPDNLVVGARQQQHRGAGGQHVALIIERVERRVESHLDERLGKAGYEIAADRLIIRRASFDDQACKRAGARQRCCHGAAGHSYGALGALALGGAEPLLPEGVPGPLRDPRAVLALAFSPPGAVAPLIDAKGYSGLAVPALIRTGTADIPPGADGWTSHLLAFEFAPARGDRFGLVLDGVDHYFGGAICRPELPGPRQLAQLDRAAALSLLMLQGWAQGAAAARADMLAAVGTRPGETLMQC